MPSNPSRAVFTDAVSVMLRADQKAMLERLSADRGNAPLSSLIREAIDKTWPPTTTP